MKRPSYQNEAYWIVLSPMEDSPSACSQTPQGNPVKGAHSKNRPPPVSKVAHDELATLGRLVLENEQARVIYHKLMRSGRRHAKLCDAQNAWCSARKQEQDFLSILLSKEEL